MKNLLLKLSGISIIFAALLFVGCGDDPIITDPLGPDIRLVADPGFVDGDSDVMLGETFNVRLTIVKGDSPLKSVALRAGNANLETSRFSINGGAITSNNPFLVTGADKDGVTYDIAITPAAGSAAGDVTVYAFTVTDDNNNTDEVTVQITVTAPATTPLEQTLTGVLLNQAGDTGTGGLNLDNGTGTGSADAAAEIRDLGIDCTIPLGTENWRAQFGTVNGAEMVRVNPAQLENFTFAAVDNKEIILEAYTKGTALNNGVSTAPNCTQTTVTDVSGTIAVGDMFAVFANSKYYLLRVDAINYVLGSVPTERNDDNIVFSIKF